MKEVIAIKQGSQTAFERVYRQLNIKTYQFFLRRVQEPETAKELTQLAYIKLWQSRNTLSDLHPIESQLMTISGSILIDHLRKQASEYKLRTALLRTLSSSPQTDNELRATTFENADYLNAVIEKLPPVRKKIMRLRIFNGLSNKEIASQLDISSKTVEDHITKALRHVRSVHAQSIISYLCLYLLLY